MLVEWTKMKVKIIPVVGANGKSTENIILLPGVTDVDDEKWNKVRSLVDQDIRTKRIIEHHATVTDIEVETEVEVKDEESGEMKKEIKKEKKPFHKGKSLKSLTPDEAEEIVKNTFNLETLNKWKTNENRDSIRAAIMNQIELVEKEGRDAAEKKKNKERRNEDI
jgi:hypothetical protein